MNQKAIELTRQEAAEHLQNFLNKGILPLFQKGDPSLEKIQTAHCLYETGIDPHGCLYPINRLWSRESIFTTDGLSPKTVRKNIGWSQKILSALQKQNGWEKIEQEICSHFGGYGYIPQEGYPPTLSGFRDMVEQLTHRDEDVLGFATYLPPKIHLGDNQNGESSPPHSTTSNQNKSTEKTLSRHQKKALQTLEKAYHIFSKQQSIGGISLRSPLLIGASGGGKTTVIRALAHQKNIDYILLDGADWILSGAATEPQSLQKIRQFVQSCDKGIVAIDECDKLGTTGEDGHAWWKSVRGEIMTVIEKRSDNWAGWTEKEKEKFQNHFFVVGLGTWQHLFRKKPSLGFQTSIPHLVNYEEIKKDNTIPEELLARFGKPIVLQSLQPEDYLEILERIHAEIGNPPPNLPELCQEAATSGKEYRWVEDYVSDILFASQEPEEKETPLHTENPELKTIQENRQGNPTKSASPPLPT
jgi:hypothetical protein